jgi:hypothetical protein
MLRGGTRARGLWGQTITVESFLFVISIPDVALGDCHTILKRRPDSLQFSVAGYVIAEVATLVARPFKEVGA